MVWDSSLRVGLPKRLLLVAVIAAAGALPACATGEDTGTVPANTATTTQPAATASTTAVASIGEASPSPSPQPVVEQRTVTETVDIPFTEKTVQDSALAKDVTAVRTQGVPGVKTLTYEVTLTNGVQTAKKLLREVVTKAPVTKVTAIGTKEQARCDPNYSGACVPIASDVDCAGGGGNGPAYVSGPVKVIGSDIYGLDSDHDGIGCE